MPSTALRPRQAAASPRPLQATLAAPFAVKGIGLHSGVQVRAHVLPAPAGTGFLFRRTDLPGRPEVRAGVAHVADTRMATTLADGAARVGTVEHLLSALVAAGVDNAVVEVDGPELPVLDGSAMHWWTRIQAATVASQGVAAQVVRVVRRVEVSNGDRLVRLLPVGRGQGVILDALVDFSHPAIGEQRLTMSLDAERYGAEVAWARTFGFAHEVAHLRRVGLARGGDLTNALVYDEEGALNPDGPRAPDEPVRHKVLDLVGDLAQLGARLEGRLEAVRPGHGMTLALLKALLADRAAYTSH